MNANENKKNMEIENVSSEETKELTGEEMNTVSGGQGIFQSKAHIIPLTLPVDKGTKKPKFSTLPTPGLNGQVQKPDFLTKPGDKTETNHPSFLSDKAEKRTL
ncbi:MAG: hypothetical protein K6F80_03330 [Oscillospiraceae bacterium]|nr:hypothetical protein [Oscillospiraceae bacterium]